MGSRADAVAERFQRTTGEVVDFVQALSDAQWRAVPDEGLPVGAMVHHLAAGDRLARGALQALVSGVEHASPATEAETADRERLQAQEAAEFAHPSRRETVDLAEIRATAQRQTASRA